MTVPLRWLLAFSQLFEFLTELVVEFNLAFELLAHEPAPIAESHDNEKSHSKESEREEERPVANSGAGFGEAEKIHPGEHAEEGFASGISIASEKHRCRFSS
jgi:hypothetical protein